MSRTPDPSTEARPGAVASGHAANTLDWQSFCTAYFPGRRRHDLEALTAYGTYRRSQQGGAASSGADAGAGTAQRTSQAQRTALHTWEDDGGAAT